MARLRTGTMGDDGQVIILDKNEAAQAYAQVNRSRLRMLKRVDEIDLVGNTAASRPNKDDPPEIQLLLALNERRKECSDAGDEAALSKVMLQTLKEVRSEANRASAEIQTLLMAQSKKSDVPTMADVLKKANGQ